MTVVSPTPFTLPARREHQPHLGLHLPFRHAYIPHTYSQMVPPKPTRQLSFRSRFSFTVFQVFSHAHYAAVTNGPRSAERTHPEHTDDGMLHQVRDLPKTSTEGDTTHHVW